MRHYKDEAKSLKSGSEGGIGLENFQDIKPGDQIEGYRIDQVARTGVGGSAMKQTQATRRLGEQLREKLGYILLFEVSDPRLDLVTLTAVEVAVDRSFARVFVSCDASRYDEVMEALASAKGRIRSLLARSLDWRVTPELDFRIDRSTDEADAHHACAGKRSRHACDRKGRGRLSDSGCRPGGSFR